MLSSVPKANQPQPHSRWGDPVIVTRGYHHAHAASEAAFLALANQRQAIVERKGDPSIVNSFGEELADETYHAPHGGKAASEIEAHITLSSSDAGVHSGVDSVTGMPWRANNSGFRCFFLGFPA